MEPRANEIPNQLVGEPEGPPLKAFGGILLAFAGWGMLFLMSYASYLMLER